MRIVGTKINDTKLIKIIYTLTNKLGIICTCYQIGCRLTSATEN